MLSLRLYFLASQCAEATAHPTLENIPSPEPCSICLSEVSFFDSVASAATVGLPFFLCAGHDQSLHRDCLRQLCCASAKEPEYEFPRCPLCRAESDHWLEPLLHRANVPLGVFLHDGNSPHKEDSDISWWLLERGRLSPASCNLKTGRNFLQTMVHSALLIPSPLMRLNSENTSSAAALRVLVTGIRYPGLIKVRGLRTIAQKQPEVFIHALLRKIAQENLVHSYSAFGTQMMRGGDDEKQRQETNRKREFTTSQQFLVEKTVEEWGEILEKEDEDSEDEKSKERSATEVRNLVTKAFWECIDRRWPAEAIFRENPWESFAD